ncbi:NAD(P)-dependent oxidoreductase [Asticcacaulis taihuensis]|uniref:3-hydroxyisobutyrate dehydrogenase n=1 Tax=Asticcacaulis taihuensis TaxID=260084 RepID=A0A1G4PWJ8_9CAUL|nr:NAD(P)-dependent oxidoreductase [Asticcacaulis taihuensis]SCW36478.1 3-hydroxyisobutyrate dehydrogenase [Asticcacaulis taihuensis]
MKVAFLGLGLMGEPMAANLLRSGVALRVWNRSAPAAQRLAALGAQVIPSATEAMSAARVVILMLRNSQAIDEVLGRDTDCFQRHVSGRILVNMGTVAPDYSAALARDVEAAGGHHVECPVSGSRGVAERAELVAMASGVDAVIAEVQPLILKMAKDMYPCGPVPGALRIKLAVNLFLITLVTGLAEAVNFARSVGLDADLFRTILDAGPMASAVSRGKLAKVVANDLTAQAAISDVLQNCCLIQSLAESKNCATPLLDAGQGLLKNAVEMGEGGTDMIGVIAAIARTKRLK